MDSLPENDYNEKAFHKTFILFCKEYCVGKAMKLANAYKSRGVPVMSIFLYLLQLVFTKKSMYMNIMTGSHAGNFKKDTVYRFLSAQFVNWGTFLLSVAMNVIKNICKLTSDDRINAIIADDSLFSRMRSKKVELLANVHDHTGKGQKFKRGFRMLTLCWTDGVTLIPMMFRHLSSENKKSRYNEINPKIDKRSCGYKARLQAISKAPDVLIQFLSMAAKAGVPAKHVLFDSWFSFPSTIIRIYELGFKVVARLKSIRTIQYLVGDRKMTLAEIYAANKKRRGKSKYLLSVNVVLCNEDKIVEARIVFVRDRNNTKKWIALISTDMELTEEEIIALYGKRWSIEVFFKICKSYLRLGAEFQQLSYDAITAHTTVVFVRYMVLAVEKRQGEDMRSMGELFFLYYDEIPDIQFAEVIEIIIEMLRDILNDLLFLTDAQIDAIMDRFVSKLPSYLCSKMIAKNTA